MRKMVMVVMMKVMGTATASFDAMLCYACGTIPSPLVRRHGPSMVSGKSSQIAIPVNFEILKFEFFEKDRDLNQS
jgi:hypothetical protein